MIITLLTTVSTECVTTIKIMLGMSEWSGDQGCEILTSAPVSWAHITQSSRCQDWTPVYHVPAHDQPGLLCSGESWNHQRHRSHMLWGNTEPVKQNTSDKIKITNYFIEAILMLMCLRTPNDWCANVVTEYMIFSMRHVGLGLTLEHHDQLTLIQPHTHMVSGHETFLPGNITSWAEPSLAPPLSHHHQHLIFIFEAVKF